MLLILLCMFVPWLLAGLWILGVIQIPVYWWRGRARRQETEKGKMGYADLERALLLFKPASAAKRKEPMKRNQLLSAKDWLSFRSWRSHLQQSPGWTGGRKWTVPKAATALWETPASLQMKWPSVGRGQPHGCQWQAEPMPLLRLAIQLQNKELTPGVWQGSMYWVSATNSIR